MNYDEIESQLIQEAEQRKNESARKRLQTAIQKIEDSGTWKAGRFSRKEKDSSRKMNKQMQEEILRENEQLREQVLEQEAVMQQYKLYHEETMRLERMQMLREMKQNGSLYHHFKQSLSDIQNYTNNMYETLVQIARLYMNEDETIKTYIYKQILDVLPSEKIPEFMVRIGLEEEEPLTMYPSYRGLLSNRLRKYQHDERLAEWQLDDKSKAYAFMKQLKVPTPKVEQATYSLAEISYREGTVIKPVDGAGGRGVYIIHDQDHIIDIKQSETFATYELLRKKMEEDLSTEAVLQDEWMIEEIIYEDKENKIPGRDIKFYMFYGKVGVILEILRYPEMRHCWWSRDLQRISVGKYDENLFVGQGVTEAEIAMVEAISKEIPSPCIRIDFLRSETGLIFGEFTPKPGNYDEFSDDIDRQLGDMFLQAETSLELDLVSGKQFTNFQQFVQNKV